MNVRVGQPLFRDARVRAALLRAIDRTGLVQTVFHGAAAVAAHAVPADDRGAAQAHGHDTPIQSDRRRGRPHGRRLEAREPVGGPRPA